MNSKQLKFNYRSVISIVLAGLILTLTAIPALAWEDEGGPNFEPVRSCQIRVMGEGASTVACGRTTVYPSSPVVSSRPIAPMGVIRAEAIFLRGVSFEQLMTGVNPK